MPAETLTTKPTTRSSLRLSFGLASKAIADVMNKDSDKTAKKGAKDTASRRLSAVRANPAAPRASMGDSNRPGSTASKRTETPDAKTVTRRRTSVQVIRQSMDEHGRLAEATASGETKPSEVAPQTATKSTEVATQGAAIPRSGSLRPRPGASNLPKYRPKSIVGDPSKPPSPGPTRAGVRRRHSVSDEEKEDEVAAPLESAAEKSMRPISPLPQRAAFKVNLTSVINAASPPAAPPKAKPAPSSASKTKASPARPTKTVKTAASSNPTAPRPESSASSSSSVPRTPKSASGKGVAAARRSDKSRASPLNDSPLRGQSESPLARRPKKGPQTTVQQNDVGNMSHISEGNSEDSDTEHVELLLAPVATPGAPTPAMPRMVSRQRLRGRAPQTPTRSGLPSRANLSYLSPLPPESDSPPSLRPQPAGQGATVGRGSILSWEQLASESSRTLGEEEIASMLSEIPAPFRAGAISPNGHLEVPESPCLSALNSPGEFGSISQVLLPDVTPSPAVHDTTRFNVHATKNSEVPVVDAAIVTLLRLQLVSAESIAKERLMQMQAMEEEIHNLKQARLYDAEELEKQVGQLENELRGNLEHRDRTDEDRTAHIALLEDQLRSAESLHEQAIDDVVARTRENVQEEADAALRSQDAKTNALWSARVVGTQWAFVRDFAESEMDAIRGDQEVLSALLADLDEMQRRMCCS